MPPALTQGAVHQLINNGPNVGAPTMQVINVKQVASGNNERFRIVISDGTHYVQGMLATQINNLVHDKVLVDNCVVVVNEHITNQVQGKPIVILLGLEIISKGDPKIGNPVEYKGDGGAGGAPSSANNASNPPSMYGSTNNSRSVPPRTTSSNNGANPYGSNSNNNNSNPYGSSPNKYNNSNNNYSNNYNTNQNQYGNSNAPVVRSYHQSEQHYTPIRDLNMYQNRWTIKARVTTKSDIKEWNNARGQGKLFSVALLDASDTDIRCTFFKEAVDAFYSMLEVGAVYTFSNGRLKVANAKWNTCKSSFEVTFDDKAEIQRVNDDSQIKVQQFDFVKVADLETMDPGRNVDLLCIVKSVGTPGTVLSKKSGQELQKCDMTLVDDSGAEISLTMWGERATNADVEYDGQPAVAFKNLRLGDFGGRSLSSSYDGAIMKEPSSLQREVQQLRSWWSATGGQGGKSLSTGVGGAGGRDSFENRKFISSIKDEHMGHGEKPDWMSLKCTFNFFKKDKDGGPWYTACPNTDEPCKNRFKVAQTTDGQYHCDKCNKTYPNCVRRFIFSATVTDDTCTTWVSIFDEQARQLFNGVTADELNTKCFGDNYDTDTFDATFAAVQFTDWIVKLKVKQEQVMDETRIKSTVYSLEKMDYAAESRELLKAIEAM